MLITPLVFKLITFVSPKELHTKKAKGAEDEVPDDDGPSNTMLSQDQRED